ncbi:MAG: hypothetical protein PUF08_04725, partial [Clostridiales bacterium]|nr:hypothetical protein [Clostridiales bacterium]
NSCPQERCSIFDAFSDVGDYSAYLHCFATSQGSAVKWCRTKHTYFCCCYYCGYAISMNDVASSMRLVNRGSITAYLCGRCRFTAVTTVICVSLI